MEEGRGAGGCCAIMKELSCLVSESGCMESFWLGGAGGEREEGGGGVATRSFKEMKMGHTDMVNHMIKLSV